MWDAPANSQAANELPVEALALGNRRKPTVGDLLCVELWQGQQRGRVKR